MRTRPIAAALLLALAPASLPLPAYAQVASDDATTAMARARFKEGVDFFDKGAFEQARASFLQAYALKKHPAVLLNLAWSCLKSGHVLEAEHYFKQFLNEGKEITDKQRADANDGLNQAHAKLGRIEIIAPQGTEVMIDGEHAGTAPLPDAAYVEPGAHTVKFKGPEGTLETSSVTVLAGEKALARMSRPAAPPPPPSTESAAPPLESTEEEPKKPAEPPPAPKREPAPETPASPSHPGIFAPPANWTPVVLGGIVAIAGGVVAGVMAHSKSQAQNLANSTGAYITAKGGMSCNPPTPATLTGLQSECNAYLNDNQDVNTDATVANIAIGVGAGALAIALIYYLVADKREEGPSASQARVKDVLRSAVIVPEVGRSSGGLTLDLTF